MGVEARPLVRALDRLVLLEWAKAWCGAGRDVPAEEAQMLVVQMRVAVQDAKQGLNWFAREVRHRRARLQP